MGGKQRDSVKCEIECQKRKNITVEILLNAEVYEKDDISVRISQETVKECRMGKIFLDIKNTSMTENFNLRMERP